MNSDKDIAENEKGWLAQELIPAISTVKNGEHRTVRELIVRYRLVIAISLATISIAIFCYCSILSNPFYLIEIRSVDPNGVVTYLPQRYEKWPHDENIAAIRQHTFNRIYHSVYYDGLQYNFSKSGHVYATGPSEAGAPFNFVRTWDWSGDPHQFPYYNFSHTWSKNG